jgi:hypothetical protein
MPSNRLPRATALAAAVALTAATTLSAAAAPTAAPTAAAAASDGSGPAAKAASPDGREAATSALTRVQRIFAPTTAARSRTLARRGVEATLALRDLAALRGSLAGADREAAEALLKRPTDSGGDGTLSYGNTPEAAPACNADVCVHYVTTSNHAPGLTDNNGNGVPDYVDATLTTFAHVHDSYLGAGYREPKADGAIGGGANLIDIYLGDIGDDGVYGYCTSDEPNPAPGPNATFDRWAYCVLDEDYAEFSTNTPIENLQVTAAHEYFHATQFAYDAWEDSWLLEATAAWVEDEMYDAVDDNRQYLSNSQMTKPHVPLDTFDQTGFHYGTWTFFRYLTEKYPTKQGALPQLVLDIFRKADGAAGGPDQFSWQAVDSVLRTKGTTGAAMLAAYAEANRRPGQVYSEARALRYPTAPLAGKVTLTPRRSSTTVARLSLDHLTSGTFRFTPQGMANKLTKLRVTLDMAPTSQGSVALVTVHDKAGKAAVSRVSLNSAGNATKAVPFSSKKVRYVEVTLVNASGRFTCWVGGGYSCQGNSVDDNLAQKVSAKAFV